MKKRISESLFAESGQICCAACSHQLAPTGRSWKKAAALSTVQVTQLPGAGSNVDPRVVFRRFACPQCGHLLDTETALPEDPFLEDVVAANPRS
jgi:acetone carboxylase gamma subunit